MKGAKKKYGKKVKGKAAKRQAQADSANSKNNSGKGKFSGPKTSNGPSKFGGGKEKSLTGKRSKNYGDSSLRFQPIVFVPSNNEFELTLESVQSTQLSMTESESESDSDVMEEDDVEFVEDRSPGDIEVDDIQEEPAAPALAPAPARRVPAQNSDDELLGSMDIDELDDMIHQDIRNDGQRIESHLHPVTVADSSSDSEIDGPEDTAQFDEESRFDEDSRFEDSRFDDSEEDDTVPPNDAGVDFNETIDDDIPDYEGEQKDIWDYQPKGFAVLEQDSDSEHESERGSGHDSEAESEADSDGDSDESSEANDHDLFAHSESENEPVGITLDDYEMSDTNSATQDYIDNMSELDDDQIFALASGSVSHNVHATEDMDAFDHYDEYDEYFDELLAEGPVAGVSDRKRLKRQARHAMHAVKFGKVPQLWQKYPHEIHIREIQEELRRFASQVGASLAFPPLDNNANWYVKQMAKEYGMRPTVEGANFEKYVVAHRTRRTSPMVGKGINKLLKMRQNFIRSDVKVVKKGKKGSKEDGRPTKLSARPKHGHIVGHNASSISEENFGHRLLKQMGWTEGSGLGKERAGIIAPISATVKLNKTGLGGL